MVGGGLMGKGLNTQLALHVTMVMIICHQVGGVLCTVLPGSPGAQLTPYFLRM